VIILSGHVDRDTVKEGEVLGIVAYITKPCEFATLLEAINNAARQKLDAD
jgi:DNA-binding NarL/FixJ family response regulator